jgi:hypothetical protein
MSINGFVPLFRQLESIERSPRKGRNEHADEGVDMYITFNSKTLASMLHFEALLRLYDVLSSCQTNDRHLVVDDEQNMARRTFLYKRDLE